MMLRAILVCLLLAAIVIPIVLAEMRRVRSRPVRQPARKRSARPDSATKPPLRLVVPKTDMDRELADLLANSRKSTESDE